MTQFTSTRKTVRSALLAVSFTALLAGCGSMNFGGEEKIDPAVTEGSAQTQTTQSSPNTMTVAAAERKSVLVCVVQDPKQNVEALERAIVEGVKATVELKKKRAIVETDVADEVLVKAVEDAGYKVVKIKE